jgi:hypothetical protein
VVRLGRWAGSAVLLGLLAAGCDASLPEAESPGARLYAARCGGCHRLYAPGVLTAAMWKITVARMQGELGRRGLSPLSVTEQATLLDYLERHSTAHEG